MDFLGDLARVIPLEVGGDPRRGKDLDDERRDEDTAAKVILTEEMRDA